MILFINCCVREESRTSQIACALLNKINDECQEIYLPGEKLQSLSLDRLNERNKLLQEGDLSNDIFKYAKQFAKADTIVIAAPFWDLSFPADLKTYIENIYVTGIVSMFDENGRPKGLCKANKLYYVTTAGGPYNPKYSYDYWQELATKYMGIKETKLIAAEMLDVEGFSADNIVKKTIENIEL